MEAITPIEYVMPSLYIVVFNRLTPQEPVAYRMEVIEELEENIWLSFYLNSIIQVRKHQIDLMSKNKIFRKIRIVNISSQNTKKRRVGDSLSIYILICLIYWKKTI